MDYIGNKCPVCHKYFHEGDDVVVCPECGTPHHRACYEQLGHCANEALHAEGFDYADSMEENETKGKRCPSCGKENSDDAFFCQHCGSPLSPQQNEQGPQQYGQPFNRAGGIPPFGAGQQGDGNTYGIPFLDPLGGVPNDTDLGDDVTAGEAAKYVKQNTPYFIRIFSNIKNFNKSKFNFAAALFTGGYMLYRKMYKIGAILTAVELLLMMVEVYISIAFSSVFTSFAQAYASSGSISEMMNAAATFLSQASSADLLVLYLPTLIDFVRIALMIVIGACFNRMYMNHCKKQIVAIKESAQENSENAETLLQTKGGVNTALAVSLMISVIIMTYLPQIIAGIF